MLQNISSNRLLGIIALLIAVASLGLWIPFDSETALVETVRRRLVIRDSLAPTVAMLLVAGAALSLIRHSQDGAPFSNDGKWHFVFGFFLLVFILSLGLMRYLGPHLISVYAMITDTDVSYRNLRNIWPLKYVGFVCGGTVLLCSFSHFMDRSLTRKRATLFVAISIAIALFFDLPFEDILLPPNGDV